MKEERRPVRLGVAIIAVCLILWLVWCAIYAYTNFYVPAWQREQALLIGTAISRDCGLSLVVTPASVQPSNSPDWEKNYAPTGKAIACALDRRSNSWRCYGCGRP